MTRPTFPIRPFLEMPLLGDDNYWDFWENSCCSGLTVYEDKQHFFVEAELPGIPKDEIDISYNCGGVSIHGSRKKEISEDKKYHRKSNKNFSYQTAIPDYVNAEADPEAFYKDGILKLKFQKKDGERKKIVIQEA